MEKPLVQKEYVLQKFPGKGGWTYAEIPEVLPDKSSAFGWVKVKGKIDDFEFAGLKLAPLGNGRLFLPVKAEIRKKIRKQAGDTVQLLLYADESALEIPEEIMESEYRTGSLREIYQPSGRSAKRVSGLDLCC